MSGQDGTAFTFNNLKELSPEAQIVALKEHYSKQRMTLFWDKLLVLVSMGFSFTLGLLSMLG